MLVIPGRPCGFPEPLLPAVSLWLKFEHVGHIACWMCRRTGFITWDSWVKKLSDLAGGFLKILVVFTTVLKLDVI